LDHSFFPFFSHDPATTEIYTLSLHDALPILGCTVYLPLGRSGYGKYFPTHLIPPILLPPLGRKTNFSSLLSLIFKSIMKKSKNRSEEHTSELQSRENLVCRLLLEKKNNKKKK